jgi:hypothetical protein
MGRRDVDYLYLLTLVVSGFVAVECYQRVQQRWARIEALKARDDRDYWKSSEVRLAERHIRPLSPVAAAVAGFLVTWVVAILVLPGVT